MTSVGRPSKLTPETIKTLTDAIGLGASYVDACTMAGLNYDTFMKWKQKGQAAKSGEYVQFIHTIEAAKTAGKMRHLAVINNAAAKGDWKASLEWLKRMFRDEWGDAAKVDLTNSDGSLKQTIIYQIPDNGRDNNDKTTS